VRFSLTVSPGLTDDFVNFSMGYLTSEISPSDVFGIFVDNVFTGLIAGSPVDQGHPWILASISGIGFRDALFLNGLGSNPESFLVSLAIPNPGIAFTLDFILVDAFNGDVDTAVFLGEFSFSTAPLGVVAIPEPRSIALVMLSSVAVLAFCRRLRRS
jgi:hypothetical protein